MADYKSNSHKSKTGDVEKKKVEKVVTGKVKTKKKNEVQKFADVFLADDMKSVKNYIFVDVLVPSIKKAVADIVKNGIDILLYGEGSIGKRSNSTASKISYGRYFDDTSTRTSTRTSTKLGIGYDFKDVILDSKGEAEEVMFRMDELIAAYGMVSVADLYDLVGITGNYTDNKYGWTDLRSAETVRLRDGGILLKLPKAIPLD